LLQGLLSLSQSRGQFTEASLCVRRNVLSWRLCVRLLGWLPLWLSVLRCRLGRHGLLRIHARRCCSALSLNLLTCVGTFRGQWTSRLTISIDRHTPGLQWIALAILHACLQSECRLVGAC
jgi:hypothetical protein